jgi:hypothetical protein
MISVHFCVSLDKMSSRNPRKILSFYHLRLFAWSFVARATAYFT